MRRFEELEKWLLEKATEEFNGVASRQRCNEMTLEAYTKDRYIDEEFIHLRVDYRVQYRREIRRLNQVIRDIKEAILELGRWR